MEVIKKYYGWSIAFAVFAILAGGAIGYAQKGIVGALEVALIVAILAVLETSLSFDNAVVNAKVLANWDERWRKIFLTWGIWIAVFGMRVVFPIAIVAVATGMGSMDVLSMALNSPDQYALAMEAVHHEVAGFGGAFLAMVGFGFFFQDNEVKWLSFLEGKLAGLGKIEGVSAVATLASVLFVTSMFDDSVKGQQFLVAAIWGVVTYVVAHGLGALLGSGENDGNGGTIVKAGLAGFLYLEILDASFSFDGVIGAFVLTNYLPVIALGLGIGAFFVRSMTIHLVDAGTLSEYRYLEHGAFYAIILLAGLMFASGVGFHLPEWATGLLGAAFIGVAFAHSVIHNRREAATA